jgi:hypothetical protein
MANIFKSLDSLYTKAGFSEKYGGSVLMTGTIIIIFFLLISYLNIMINIQPIKDDWVNQRCSPGVMPFAGLINPPPGVSAFQYTNDNFAQCTQGILQQITGYFLLPINLFVQVILSVFNMMNESINKIRDMFNLIRVKIKAIAEDLMGKILNIMIPLQKIFMSINDLFGKVQGILASGLYVAIGTYYTMKSSVGAFFEFCVILLIILAAMVVTFWAIPVTWGLAIAMTVIFVAIAIPLGMISDALRRAFDLSLPGLPSKPGCFSKNTVISTSNGNILIEDLKVGTTLSDDSIVTAIMKINAKEHTMYNLNNIIVSGEHKVIYNKKLIPVSEHPDAVKLNNFNEQIIYCFSTNTKYITLNNTLFADWDELTKSELNELRYNCKSYISEKYNNNSHFIHKNLESGFNKKTKIQLKNGTVKKISDICLLDTLKNNEIVLGIVEIQGNDIEQYSYFFNNNNNNTEICGAPNLQIYNANLGILHTLNNQIIKKTTKSSKKLYHLITDKGKFEINGYIFYDYNGALDGFLSCQLPNLLTL